MHARWNEVLETLQGFAQQSYATLFSEEDVERNNARQALARAQTELNELRAQLQARLQGRSAELETTQAHAEHRLAVSQEALKQAKQEPITKPTRDFDLD